MLETASGSLRGKGGAGGGRESAEKARKEDREKKGECEYGCNQWTWRYSEIRMRREILVK